MNSGRYVLCQVLDLVHWQTLSRLVQRYDAESKVRHFGCRQQLICMAFAQLTWREGLRDIATCLNARGDPDLDRTGSLPHGSHPPQATPTPWKTPQDFPALEYSSI